MDELFTAIVNLLGIGMLAVVFLLGGYVTNFFRRLISGVAQKHNLGYDSVTVDLIGKGIVILVSLAICLPAMPPFVDVLDAMMPIGSFAEVSAEFAATEGKWLFNLIFDIISKQLGMSMANFIPFILVNLALSLVKQFLCDGEQRNSRWKIALCFGADILMLYAINALVLRTGTLFPQLMLQLLDTYRLSSGIGYLLVMLIPALLLLFAVIRDVIGSDMLMSILGVNIVAAVMQITVTDANRWYIFAIALGCGMVSRLIKSAIACKEENFIGEAIGALLTLLGTALVSWLIFRI